MLSHFSLRKYNTFGIDVYAKYFSEFNSAGQLEDLLNDVNPQPATLILGGGSNILFTTNFNGLVLKNCIRGISMVKEDDGFFYIQAGAGDNWHRFVLHCIENHYYGVENLSLIPGNVGASPMQNIGAYGVELKDVFYELEAFHLREKTVVKFTAEECAFGYRESVFKNTYKNHFAILNVTFKLPKSPRFNISYGAVEQELKDMNVSELSMQAISRAIINIRSSKLPDPAVIGNAGSFFKNPVISTSHLNELKQTHPGLPAFKIDDEKYKIAAAWLIEQCGWKGYRKGDAGCHDKQALVLVNFGNARGEEVYELSEKIKESVKQRFNIHLQTEVNIV